MDLTRTIEQARLGSRTALHDLLEGCQSRALQIAESFTDDRDDAQDLGQEILIRLVRSLPDLDDPRRFWGWFSVLAHRVCLGWRRTQDRLHLILGGLTVQDEREDPSVAANPFLGPEDRLVEKELREGIRQALAAVSQQARRALGMYYLEGFSTSEIAGRLGIAENTLRQRLYHGRRQLGKELAAMPETAAQRLETIGRPVMRFSLWGQKSSDASALHPFGLTRSLLAQQVLAEIGKEQRTEEAIATEVGADRIYIADCLADLVQGELVRATDDGGYLADCFILSSDDQEALSPLKREIGPRDAEIIAAHADDVRDAFSRCPFESLGFPWEDMRWILLAVLVGNLGVRRACSEIYDLEPPMRPDGYAWYFFGAAKDARDTAGTRWTAGCNTSLDERGGGSHLWTPAIEREGGYLPGPGARQIICALAEGPRDLDRVAGESEEEDLRTDLAEMIQAGWIAKEGDRLRLAVPVFAEAEDRVLCPVVDDICREIVEESRKPGLEGLEDLLDELGFSHLRAQYPAMRASASSSISGYCFEALVELGLLGKPPKTVSDPWGCWAWKGPVKVTHTGP
ncbi:MAG: sigma-70 family RNA polymerase sigma factor [Candidatus Latescibacteria bacterium]|nr:sigma-70 family RNA polymerase sigma factor [Candidatus Latescibacterota bacterium]